MQSHESQRRNSYSCLKGPLLIFMCLIFLLVSYTSTQWILDPQPYPSTNYYERRKCKLIYSSLLPLSSNTVNGKRKSLINNKTFALMQPLPMRVVTAPFTCSSYYVTDSTPLPLPWSLPCAVNPSLIACHNVVRMKNKIILHYYLKYLPWGSKYHYYLQSSVNKAYQISKKTAVEKYDLNLSGMFSSALAHIHLLYNLCCHQ